MSWNWRHVPGTTTIERRNGSVLDEVDIDESGMTVRLEAGTGYMHISLDTHVPMSVLVEAFRRAGYGVTELPNTSETMNTESQEKL